MQTEKKDEGIETQENQKNLIAGWSLTSLCNLSCMHCYNDSGKKKGYELSTDEALQIVKKLSDSNVQAVNFGGGECAIRPDFLTICEALAENKIEVSYTTNGTTFDRIKNHLNLFHDIGVSIDFSDAKIHDFFRGNEGTFEKAIKTIDHLVEYGMDTEIVTCLNRQNASEKELSGLFELAKNHNVDFWRLNKYRANGRAVKNTDFLALTQKTNKVAYDFFDKARGDKLSRIADPVFRSIYGGSYQLPGDPSGKYSFRIQANGEVTPSVFLHESGGNILEKPLELILDSELFKKARNRTAQGKCIPCKEYYHCQGGDAGASYLAYGHFNGPDPLCYKNTSLPKNDSVKQVVVKDPNVHELYLCTMYIPIKK
ncbi:MAG: radical SAM protein [Nanoarchaeota archaeon]|nr:radical SAM protein [Nanoarchaeota archaeon]